MTAPITWRRAEVRSSTPEGALRGGADLLAATGEGDPATIVWWRTTQAALVMGRGSRVSADARACAEAGIPVLRRASGGGPVLWGPDLLACDVVVPRDHPLHRDDVVDAYRWFGEAIATALGTLGLAATALPPHRARALDDPVAGPLACFAGRSPWEVEAAGRKVAGLAQVRRRTGTLLQAGIMLSEDDGQLADLLDLDGATREVVRERLRPAGDPTGITFQALDVVAAVNRALPS